MGRASHTPKKKRLKAGREVTWRQEEGDDKREKNKKEKENNFLKQEMNERPPGEHML